MKVRKFAALLLGVFLLVMQVVTVQAASMDEGPTMVDKFPDLDESTYAYGNQSMFSEFVETSETSEDAPIQIDKFTGEEITEGSNVGGSLVYVNDTVSYDKEEKAFVYYTDKDEVFSNVASGMVTTDPVWLYFSETLTYHLYKDGELLTDVDFSSITEPGSYTFTGDEVIDKTEILHFTIVSRVTGRLSRFQVPDGFAISAAYLNNNKIASTRTYVDMVYEGDYDISYRCPATEEIYLFRITVDHTPPVLALADLREDGTAKGPVDISDLEEGAEIGIWLNRHQIPYEQVLTKSGRYQIIITDAAGNMTNYDFLIRVYYNTNSIIFFAAILAIGIGVGIYALYSRRHMRIR